MPDFLAGFFVGFILAVGIALVVEDEDRKK